MAVLSSGNTHIWVTPEVLISRAAEVTQKIDSMDRVLQSIQRKVNATKSYWTGEASDVCRRQYISEQEEISEIMKRLKNQPRTLLTIANVYKQTEEAAQNISVPLPGNIID